MFCPNCGNKPSKDDIFCANCGNQLNNYEGIKKTENSQVNKGTKKEIIHKSIIEGRISRKEFALVVFIPYLLAIAFLLATGKAAFLIIFIWIILGYFVSIRRLHDLNKSAWWLLFIALSAFIITVRKSLELIGFDTINFDSSIIGLVINVISIVGIVLFLSLLFAPGTKGDNKFGPAPAKKISWRGAFLNIYSENEKMDVTYLLVTVTIFTIMTLVAISYFLN